MFMYNDIFKARSAAYAIFVLKVANCKTGENETSYLKYCRVKFFNFYSGTAM